MLCFVDEQAFVSAAMNFGYSFVKRDLESGTATLRMKDERTGKEEETEM